MLKGVSLPKTKDKYGNNMKEHLGVFKYFIDTKTMQREKYYITLQGERVEGRQAVELSKREADKAVKRQALRNI